jgi:hypothetical protein
LWVSHFDRQLRCCNSIIKGSITAEGDGFELRVPRENIPSTPSIAASGKGPNASFISHPRFVPPIDANLLARRSVEAAHKRSSLIAGTKLLPAGPSCAPNAGASREPVGEQKGSKDRAVSTGRHECQGVGREAVLLARCDGERQRQDRLHRRPIGPRHRRQLRRQGRHAGADGTDVPEPRPCLKAAGATWADVVKTNTFVTDFDEFHPNALSRVATPTSTTVGVTRLAGPDFMIEIEAVAVVNS